VRYTNPQGIVESWEYFMAHINVRFEWGDRFEFNWNPKEKRSSQRSSLRPVW
jgi:hypothetical protein